MALRTAIASPSKRHRVLVADDHRSTVLLIRRNLESQGMDVLTAYDGVEALAAIQTQLIDLLILDVMMPRKDGFQVLKELRMDPAYENLPVIMLTAKAEDKDVFLGYHYGADMYLTKPFNPKELTTFLRDL